MIPSKERLQKIASWRENYGAGSNVMLPAEEAEELARIALAAMDSEPFAYIIQDKYERERGVEGHLSRSHVSKYVSQEDINEHEITCTPLYRHAQQPVVPDERKSFESFMAERFGDSVDHRRAKNGDQGYMAWDMVVAWTVWQARATMLQAEPVTTANKLGNSPVIPDGYVMVPKDLLSELRDWAHPEIEKYCEMWEGRRNSEFPALRKVIADADALLAAAPHNTPALNSVQSVVTVSDTWIPVNERMPEDGEHVIVFHPRDGVVQITFFFAYGKWWDAAEDDGGLAKSYFTHWMPLPAAPQEVKGE